MEAIIERLVSCRLHLSSASETPSAQYVIKELIFSEIGIQGLNNTTIEGDDKHASCQIQTRSGRSDVGITISCYDSPSMRRLLRVHLDLLTMQQLKVHGAKSFNEARNVKMQQLGDGLRRWAELSQLELRPGSQGPLELHVNLEDLPASSEGILEAASVLKHSIVIFEQ